MKVLVINTGSSSFKYQLLDMTTKKVLCSGLVERIGEAMGKLAHKIAPNMDWEEKIVIEQPFPNHVEGMRLVVKTLTDPAKGVIKNSSEVEAIGHRVVQGGEAYKESCLVTDEVKEAIREQIPLAPLHNPANLAGIEVAETVFPNAPSVAVFDTEFHQTMPQYAFMYALPYDLYETLRLRRYGFHGTSHRYVMHKAAEFLKKPLDDFNIITCHLGNGCSMCAVKGGKSVDTSMGMTPLAGLMMGSRCGDIDPAIHDYLSEHKKLSIREIDALLNKESGLKGIAGMHDMRDLQTARVNGDKKAQLAFEMFCHRIRQYIGAYYAELGRVDAVVFTAGIGENDDMMRAEVCANLAHMGIELDLEANARHGADMRAISKPGASVSVLVVPTNEELAIAEITARIAGGSK